MPRQIKLPLKPPPVQSPEKGKPPFPAFTPLHPKFVGLSRVLSAKAHTHKNPTGESYVVDLGAGTCTCPYGKTWGWDAKHDKWVPFAYCSHKIRALADIVERANRPRDMQAAYCKAVASRYNVFEVVSAFHKELRRGAVDEAVFWGHMLATFRGVKGVINYLLGIIYEETRDHGLAEALLKMQEGKYFNSDGGYTDMVQAIRSFCLTTKKWELEYRYLVFENEMRAYGKLVDKYGRDVARMLNVIPDNQKDHLRSQMIKGFREKDFVLFQYGFKGLQALVTGDGNLHRAWIANKLIEMSDRLDDRLLNYIQGKANGVGISYHDLNMLADHVTGENYNVGLFRTSRGRADLADDKLRLRLGVAPPIPIYAHDNHTWAGKALLRKYPKEWQPGAVQEHMDLRLCGAYLGVAWRTLAWEQHESISVPWENVRWPDWLHEVVSQLWY